MLNFKACFQFFKILSCCLSLLIAARGNADDVDIQAAIDAYKEAQRSWEFGVSAGYGVRTNPFINANDIPLYVVLNMAWYGDWLFFDNGDLGLNFFENETLSLNLMTHINNERTAFEWFDKGVQVFGFPGATAGTSVNELSTTSGSAAFPGAPGDLASQESTVVEIPDRGIAVDAGLEIMYADFWGELQLQLLSDISFQHKGFEIWASYSYPWQYGSWQLTPSLGFVWKSRNLLNYYYGVRADEAHVGLPAYQAGSGTNAFVRLAAVYSFSRHWGVVGVLEYECLSASIHNSPIVDRKSIETVFIGLTYQF